MRQSAKVAGKIKFTDAMIQHAPPSVTQTQKETPKMSENMNGSAELGETAQNSTSAASESAKDESPIKVIRRAWEAAGAVPLSAEEGQKLKSAYRKAKADVEAASAAETQARKVLSDVSKRIMEKTGGVTITIDGVDHIPSVHGQSYFYRTPGSREKKERTAL